MTDDQKPRSYDNLPRQGEALLLQSGIDDIKREQAEQKKKEEEYREHDRSYKDKQIRLNVWLVIVGLAGIFISIYNSSIADKAAIAAKNAADTAAAGLVETRKATAAAEQAARASENQTLIQGTQIGIARDQMAASNKAAADQLGSQREAFASDQRAWVVVRDCAFNKEPAPHPTGPGGKLRPTLLKEEADAATVRLSCGIFNTGKTPALDVRNSVLFRVGARPFMDWKKTTFDGPNTIFPGNDKMSVVIERLLMAADANLRYQNKTEFFVVIRSEYEDTFGTAHWTEACYSRMIHDALSQFRYCGVAIDHQGQGQPHK